MRDMRGAWWVGLLLGAGLGALPPAVAAQEGVRPTAPAQPLKADTTEVEAPDASMMPDEGVPPPIFGSQVGAQFKTVTGTIMTFQLYTTRPLNRTFRWGVQGFASSGPDLREYALSGTVGLRKGLSDTFALYLYGGFGFLYSTWDVYEDATFSDNSWALYVPGGLTLEIDIGSNLFTVTGMVNLHNIDYTNSPGRDRGSVSLLFGVAM